jgi:hypothetical protein
VLGGLGVVPVAEVLALGFGGVDAVGLGAVFDVVGGGGVVVLGVGTSSGCAVVSGGAGCPLSVGVAAPVGDGSELAAGSSWTGAVPRLTHHTTPTATPAHRAAAPRIATVVPGPPGCGAGRAAT